MLAILASVFYFWPGSNSGTAANQKSIAVLPLENLSPDLENAFFADSVQEDILTNLTKIEQLLVIGRTSTLQYREVAKSLKQIGKELDVQYLVQGSVRRDDDQIQVSVQLVDPQTGRYMWAENYNYNLERIFEIQATIAKEIAGELQAVITPREIAQIEYRPTRNQEAYDSFVKYKHLIAARPGYTEEKIVLLNQAVALDPEFAEAWAQLAIESLLLWNNRHRIDHDLYTNAYDALKKIRRLEPGSASHYYAEGLFANIERNDREAAIDHLLKALEVDPSLDKARSILGVWYWQIGHLAQAQYILEELLRRDPSLEWANRNLYKTYMARKNWEKVRGLIDRNLKRGAAEEDVWRFRTHILDYVKSGNKQAYIAAVNTVGGMEQEEAQRMNIRKALFSHDYDTALKLINEETAGARFSLFSDFEADYSITPIYLLSALILFEIDERDDWLKATEKAKRHLENIIETNPDTSPEYLSNLAVCYALEGD